MVGTEHAVDQEVRNDKRNQSEQPINCDAKVDGSSSSRRFNNFEDTSKEAAGKDGFKVNSNVVKSSDGVQQRVEKEILIAVSHSNKNVDVSNAKEHVVGKVNIDEASHAKGQMDGSHASSVAQTNATHSTRRPLVKDTSIQDVMGDLQKGKSLQESEVAQVRMVDNIKGSGAEHIRIYVGNMIDGRSSPNRQASREERLNRETDQFMKLANTKKVGGKWGEVDVPAEERAKRKVLKTSFDSKKALSGIGGLHSEVDEEKLNDRPLDEEENTSPSRKVSQWRSLRTSNVLTKKVSGPSASSTDPTSFLTTEELSELGKITTQTTRDKFLMNSGYRRDWMERNEIFDFTSSFEVPGKYAPEDYEDDELSENFLYEDCDSETLVHALSLARGRNKFRLRTTKGRRRQ